MAVNETTTGSPMDDHTNSQDPQPILLTSSDTLPLAPPSSSAMDDSEKKNRSGATDEDDSSLLLQDKRKWDQVADESSQNHSTRSQSPPINDNDNNQDSDDPLSSFWISKKPGRKPMTDEDPSDDDDPKVKRKAQNRAAQRAFRERKERYVHSLENKLKQVQDTHTMATNHLFQENHQLRSIVYRLEAENLALKGIHLQQDSLSGKPVQEWVNSLQQHQHLLTTNGPFAPILSAPLTSSIPTTATASIYSLPSSQDMLRISSLVAQHPPPNLTTNAGPTPSSNQQQQQKQPQQPQKYTFSVSTPATLRSRHKKQHRSSVSPPLAPKPQRSPVELVRLYPHEQSTMHPTTAAESSSPAVGTPGTPTAHLSPPSPAISSTQVSSSTQTPTPFGNTAQEDDEEEEGYNNVIDLLLSSEPFFNTVAGRLDDSPGFSRMDDDDDGQQQEHHPLLQQDHLASASPSSCSSSLFDTIHDYDSTRTLSTTTIASSAHDIWDGLDQRGASFEHYSSDQLLKSMVNATCVDPVVLEDYIG